MVLELDLMPSMLHLRNSVSIRDFGTKQLQQHRKPLSQMLYVGNNYDMTSFGPYLKAVKCSHVLLSPYLNISP